MKGVTNVFTFKNWLYTSLILIIFNNICGRIKLGAIFFELRWGNVFMFY